MVNDIEYIKHVETDLKNSLKGYERKELGNESRIRYLENLKINADILIDRLKNQ